MSNVVPRLSKTPGRVEWTGPEMGSTIGRSTATLGISDDELEQMKAEGVI